MRRAAQQAASGDVADQVHTRSQRTQGREATGTGATDEQALRIDRARLEAGTTQVALDQPHSAVGMEWSLHGAEHFGVTAGSDLAPCERLTVEPRLLRIVG